MDMSAACGQYVVFMTRYGLAIFFYIEKDSRIISMAGGVTELSYFSFLGK